MAMFNGYVSHYQRVTGVTLPVQMAIFKGEIVQFQTHLNGANSVYRKQSLSIRLTPFFLVLKTYHIPILVLTCLCKHPILSEQNG